MRKITKTVVDAFLSGEYKRCGNSVAYPDSMTLHGNPIAERRSNGSIWFTFAGWATATTKDRINGLLDAVGAPRINFKAGCIYWAGQRLNSREWYEVKQ